MGSVAPACGAAGNRVDRTRYARPGFRGTLRPEPLRHYCTRLWGFWKSGIAVVLRRACARHACVCTVARRGGIGRRGSVARGPESAQSERHGSARPNRAARGASGQTRWSRAPKDADRTDGVGPVIGVAAGHGADNAATRRMPGRGGSRDCVVMRRGAAASG